MGKLLDIIKDITANNLDIEELKTELEYLVLGDEQEINLADEDGNTPLIIMASDNNFDAVKLLLEHGADPTIVSTDDYSALDWAAVDGNVEIVLLLLENVLENKNKLAVIDTIQRMLRRAVEQNKVEVVKSVLETLKNSLSDKPINDDIGFSEFLDAALAVAQNYGRLKIIEILNSEITEIKSGSAEQETVLHKIINQDDIDLKALGAELERIFASDADEIHKAKHTILSRLNRAVLNGDAQIVENIYALLKIKTAEIPGSSKIWFVDFILFVDFLLPSYLILQACREGHANVVQVLLKYEGAIRKVHNGYATPLVLAQHGNHSEVLDVLLQSQEVKNQINWHLECAIEMQEASLVAKLLENGADPNIIVDRSTVGFKDITLLMRACVLGNAHIVGLLFDKAGEDIVWEIPGYRDTYTPFSCACAGGNVDVVRTILDKLVKKWEDDKPKLVEDISPISDKQKEFILGLRQAALRGHETIVNLLLDHELFQDHSVNIVKSKYNITPLMEACTNGNPNIVRRLIERHAVLDDRYYGSSALDMAVKGLHVGAVKVFLEALKRQSSINEQVAIEMVKSAIKTLGKPNSTTDNNKTNYGDILRELQEALRSLNDKLKGSGVSSRSVLGRFKKSEPDEQSGIGEAEGTTPADPRPPRPPKPRGRQVAPGDE